MPRTNDDVAAAFQELADLLELVGADRFKIIAYRRVAEEIASLAKDISEISDAEVSALKGVGKATSAKIKEFLQTGTIAKLEEARAAVPAGLRAMTQLPGLGPKKAMLINSELGISDLEQLRHAIDQELLRDVKGLGPKTEANLLKALDSFAGQEKRVLLDVALAVAEDMVSSLRASSIVGACDYAGSLRRMRETIGDIDLLVTSQDAPSVMALFGELHDVVEILAAGSTKSSVMTKHGLQVDLRVVAADEYGAAMQYFTGSQAHNVAVREISVKKGLKLSEYGLFKVKMNERVAGESEDEVYSALGLQTPAPTMRENKGEIQLALKGELPKLITIDDIKGDLHSHTNFSDGTASVDEMVDAAAELGYSYFAITDHGRNPFVRSLTVESAAIQAKEIAAARERFGRSMSILHGIEVDVEDDGSLSVPSEIIEQMDLVIVSIHGGFTMSRGAMTKRIISAITHPRVNIFAHPTARRIGKRPPIEFDLEAVFKVAAERSVALEVNSTPSRLDLKDDHIRLAKDLGCKFSIDTDAHGPSRLTRMKLGVGTAQRGWLTKDAVINTFTIHELKKFLSKTS